MAIYIDQKCSGRIDMFLGSRNDMVNIFNDTQLQLMFHQIEYNVKVGIIN